MSLPAYKTKIVCTIGPASRSPEILEEMILAGMSVARLNFSHGDFADHREVIKRVRAAAGATGRRVAIMADLPGPKIRLGRFSEEPVELQIGDSYTLTTDDVAGDRSRASTTFDRLTSAAKLGDTLSLNDGLVQLEVEEIVGNDVRCRVVVGGELRSRKGLNLPDIDLGMSAFTERDRECMAFALGEGVDAISQSFVESAADIEAVRSAAEEMGHDPFVIAKLERSAALDHIDAILDAADGIMVARGDLGVEIPIERIAIVQKDLIGRANALGKPVITATQMLVSMTGNRRPTRAESTDVANAILDGTDCVMLSEESAMGQFPVDATAMLARIAGATEPNRPKHGAGPPETSEFGPVATELKDLVCLSIQAAMTHVTPTAVLVPTLSGASARSLTRYRLPVWIAAVSPQEKVCQELQFSYGVIPLHEPVVPDDWNVYVRE